MLGGYTEWLPGHERGLTVNITVRYPSHESQRHITCRLPDDMWMLKVALTRYTPGKPSWLRRFSALGKALHLWRHHGHVHWMREQALSESLNNYALHRLCDLLGAFALVHPSRLPAGTVTSVFGGHRTDLELIHKEPRGGLVYL